MLDRKEPQNQMEHDGGPEPLNFSNHHRTGALDQRDKAGDGCQAGLVADTRIMLVAPN